MNPNPEKGRGIPLKTGPFSKMNVYISGGSSGIGLAAAKHLAACDANVFIFARRPEALASALSEIERLRSSPSQRFMISSIDVTSPEEVSSKLLPRVSEFGTPHVVINSAGFSYPDYFENISLKQFKGTLDTNLCGTWNVLQCLLPLMRETGGHIVNVSSIAGFIGIFGYTAYSASKFGVIGLSLFLKDQLKSHGIKVSVLCPPDTDTPGLVQENLTKPYETRAISENAGLMSAEQVAGALLRGMNRGAFLIIPGMEGKCIHLVKQLFPRLLENLLDARISKSRKKMTRHPSIP